MSLLWTLHAITQRYVLYAVLYWFCTDFDRFYTDLYRLLLTKNVFIMYGWMVPPTVAGAAGTANCKINAIFPRKFLLKTLKECRKHPWKEWISIENGIYIAICGSAQNARNNRSQVAQCILATLFWVKINKIKWWNTTVMNVARAAWTNLCTAFNAICCAKKWFWWRSASCLHRPEQPGKHR